MDLSGRIYVITGATSGIGRAVAAILTSRGASVIGVGRSRERCMQAESYLKAKNPASQNAFLLAELSLQSQVRQLADEIRQRLGVWGESSLDGLVNNAGTFTFKRVLTAEGFEMQWAVNHLAPFLLTRELLPQLQDGSQSCVVTVSSSSHYLGRIHWQDTQLELHYNGLRAYRQSKLANVLFTAELNRRLDGTSTLKAFAADPGLVQTDIGVKGNPSLVGRIWKLRSASGITPAESARGIVSLLEQAVSQQVSGLYWQHGQPKKPSWRARDVESARRLWTLSAGMCGINENLP